MTLIAVAQAPEWVVMAADRLLSYGKMPRVRNAIKLVVYQADMIFGYTGYASLVGKNGRLMPTDHWIAEVLAANPTRSSVDAILLLQQRLGAVFPLMAKHDRFFPSPHEILGVGWDRTAGTTIEQQQPVLMRLSNMYGQHGVVLKSPTTRFYCTANTYDSLVNRDSDGRFLLRTTIAGYLPDKKSFASFTEAFEESQITAPISPVDIVLQLKKLIKDVSRQLGGRMVGGDVLGALLFREPPSPSHIAFAGLQSNVGIAFSIDEPPYQKDRKISGAYFTYPEGRPKKIYEAPNIVAKGFKCVGYFGATMSKKPRPFSGANFHVTRDENGDLTGLLSPAVIKKRKGRR